MPLLIKGSIGPGSIKQAGNAIQAREKIEKGTIVWIAGPLGENFPTEGCPNLPNTTYTEEELKEMIQTKSREEVFEVIHFTLWYPDAKVGIFVRDGFRMVNHSFEPNIRLVLNQDKDWQQVKLQALRDIEPGEDILLDYCYNTKQGSGWLEPYIKEYDPERLQLEIDLKIDPKTPYYEA